MGGLCSRRSTDDGALGGALPHVNGRFSYGPGIVYQSRGLNIQEENVPRDVEVTDKPLREPFSCPGLSSVSRGTNMEDIGDGIPHLSRALSDKSRSTRTKQVALTKVTYSIPFALASIFSSNSGSGQGLSLGVLNLAIVIPQMVVSVTSGPWDDLFGGGNLPAFVVGAVAAAISGILALTMLPSPPAEVVATKALTAGGFH